MNSNLLSSLIFSNFIIIISWFFFVYKYFDWKHYPCCCCSAAKSCPTCCNPMDCSTPCFPVLHYLPEFCSDSCPLSRWCHLTISLSVIPVFSCSQSFPASGSFPGSQLFTPGGQSDGVSSFSINPSNEYSGLIYFRIDWFDLLAVQGTLKSLLQQHSSKASILAIDINMSPPS